MASRSRVGKREYLNNKETKLFIKALEERFGSEVKVPLIRAHTHKQRIETLINEETLLLAKYLRGERRSWVPRIPGVV